MIEHGVVVAGGGPVGMMVAAELALAGVDVGIVERRADQVLAGSRAGGLHARTLEVFDQRGVVDRFLSEGRPAQAVMVATTVLDMSDFPTRHPYSLGIWQNQIERIMADWIAELGVRVHRGREVVGCSQDDDGVTLGFADGDAGRAGWLVGCDGGRSLVRRQAGIDFPGWEATHSSMIAEVELTQEPPAGMRTDAAGVSALHRMEDGRTFRVVVAERHLAKDSAEPSLGELSEALISVYGTDFGVHDPTWISRFTDATRQAAAYRAGRILVAGDAAHIQFPAGGQGLSLGVQDAANLGWKLAQVAHGTSPDALLDSYHAERHPVGARALRYSMALGALQRQDDRIGALAEIVSEWAVMDGPRQHLAGVISGLDIRYDVGAGHPLLGRRMPDLDLTTADGPARLYQFLRDARPLLIRFRSETAAETTGWEDRVRILTATTAGGPWQLPVVGDVAAPGAVLVRPDGYVAWTDDQGQPALRAALATWFGSPRPDS